MSSAAVFDVLGVWKSLQRWHLLFETHVLLGQVPTDIGTTCNKGQTEQTVPSNACVSHLMLRC